METSETIQTILSNMKENPILLVIIIIVFLLVLFLLFKSGGGGSEERPGGMNPLQWEVFKKKQEKE